MTGNEPRSWLLMKKCLAYTVNRTGLTNRILIADEKRNSCCCKYLRAFDLKISKYVRPRNNGKEMYAGRVVCCPQASHVEYAPTGQTDRLTLTDGRQTVTLCFPLNVANIIIIFSQQF